MQMPYPFLCFFDQNKFPISSNSQAENQESWNLLRKRSFAPIRNCLPLFVDMPSNMAMSSLYIARQPTDKSFLAVDQGGQYRDRATASAGEKRRFTTTRRINCPFKLYGKRLPDGRWEVQIRFPTHNHDTENLSGMPYVAMEIH